MIPPRVSVIVVNWNTRDMLRDCLASIRQQTESSHEVIVVDNASRDGSQDMVRGEFPAVQLVANTDNKGFAAANNQGIRISAGNYVLLLNPDTIVLDHAIDAMLGWMDQNPDVGCGGCQVFETETTIQQTCFADPNLMNQMIIELGGLRLARHLPALGRPWYLDWDRRSQREVDVVSGMFMLIPRHVLDATGLLDEAFFIYAEEADLCRRIRSAGWKCVFTPIARIIHRDGGSKSTAQIKSRMHVQMQKSHMIYVRKHGGATAAAALRVFLILTSLARLSISKVASLWNGNPETAARARLSLASLRYHLLGKEPVA